MSNLAELVDRRPDVADNVFAAIEGGLNQVLPLSFYHPRYEEIGEVGLAIVVGKPDEPTFNPFEISEHNGIYIAENSKERPTAWQPIEEDSEFLAGRATDLPRFVFFALAKTERMRKTGLSESWGDKLAIEPGVVGFAGGRKRYEAFVTASGLWEVHDHIVAVEFADEIVAVTERESEPKTADTFAVIFEEVFAEVESMLDGASADKLTRVQVRELVTQLH